MYGLLKIKNKSIVLAALAFSAMLAAASPALSDLMIMPIRVVFTDRDRMKALTVINNSNERAIFRMKFKDQRQIESGSYQELDEPLNPEFDVSKMIVYSPRQVDLPPQGKQSIRLSLRRPENMPDGEYRTHLRMQRMAAPETEGGRAIRAKVGINVGFSVPVILRKGVYDATATISEFKYKPAGTAAEKDKAQAEMYLVRGGKYSTLGKLEVFWTPPGGEEKKVGELNGVNVFTDVQKRWARVYINEKNIQNGQFRVTFTGIGPDKGILFDEKTFPAG